MKTLYASQLKLRSSKLMQSLFLGNFKAAFSGKGIEFQDFRAYSHGDDARYIDWLTSSREGTTVMRRYTEEKQADILCIFDFKASCEYETGSPKKALAQEVIQLLGEVSLQSGEAFGGFILHQEGNMYIPAKKSSISLHLFQAIETLCPTKILGPFSLSFFLKQLKKRSLVFCISDSLDIDEKSFKIAALKHDIVYVHLATVFENTLEGTGIASLRGAGQNFGIDLDDERLKAMYREKRHKQLKDFAQKLRKIGIDSIFLDEKKSVFGAFLECMKRRESRRI